MTPRPRNGERVRRRSRRWALVDDRGSIALWYAVTAIAALVMAGFVLDGGAALAARERAADLATQAARAGADALAPASLRALPGGLAPNPAAAQAAAVRVLAAGSATGDVSVEGGRVTVTATVHKHTVILSAVGLDDVSQTATASAFPIYGRATQAGG